MSTTRLELIWAEKIYRVVCQAIPPLLASGYISVHQGCWLLAVFLGTLCMALVSAYLGAQRHPLRSRPYLSIRRKEVNAC